jgi:hypothetical protein
MLCLCRIQVLEIAQARGYPIRWHRLHQKVGRFASRTLSVEPPGIVPADEASVIRLVVIIEYEYVLPREATREFPI